jgi:hypothetical protein
MASMIVINPPIIARYERAITNSETISIEESRNFI